MILHSCINMHQEVYNQYYVYDKYAGYITFIPIDYMLHIIG